MYKVVATYIKYPEFSSVLQVLGVLPCTITGKGVAKLIMRHPEAGFDRDKVIELYADERKMGPNFSNHDKLWIIRYLEKDYIKVAQDDYTSRIGPLDPVSSKILSYIYGRIIPDLKTTNPQIFGLQVFEEEGFNDLIKIINDIVGYQVQAKDFPAKQFTEAATNDYKDLKQKLVAVDHPQADEFNERQDNLFKWCLVVIEELVFGPLNDVMRMHHKEDISAEGVSARLAKSSVEGTKVAVLDTRIDDISDNIKDRKLTELFVKIPTLEGQLDEVIRDVSSEWNGSFTRFFTETNTLWTSIKTSLSSIANASAHHSLFMKNMQELMDVMLYSVEVNTEKRLDDFNYMLTKLAPNMMVKILFDIQLDTLLDVSSESLKSCVDFIKEDLYKLFELLEVSFHMGNCFATFNREINETDVTNSMFKLAEIIAHDNYKLWRLGTHEAEENNFKEFLHTRYLNGSSEQFSEDVQINEFLDLFKYEDNQTSADAVLKKKLLMMLVSDPRVIDAYYTKWKEYHIKICNQVDAIKEKLDQAYVTPDVSSRTSLVSNPDVTMSFQFDNVPLQMEKQEKPFNNSGLESETTSEECPSPVSTLVDTFSGLKISDVYSEDGNSSEIYFGDEAQGNVTFLSDFSGTTDNSFDDTSKFNECSKTLIKNLDRIKLNNEKFLVLYFIFSKIKGSA